MKLIVGLGNLGLRFKSTRHNAGFLIVEELAHVLGEGEEWIVDPDTTTSRRSSKFTCDLLFAKPRTSMNASGRAVEKVVDQKGIELDHLLLVHDDLDLSLGDFKLQKGRGPAGHKGVQSVIDALGSKDFWRLRVGVGRPPEGAAAEDYVLEDFTSDERKVINRLVEEELVEVVRDWGE